jgi:hypothetical protein
MNVDESIYLNTFKKEEVLRALKLIIKLKITGLIILNEKSETSNLISMSYIPYLHRLDIKDFDGGLLFCNPSCTCKIASISHFIQSLKPSEFYHELMNSSWDHKIRVNHTKS